MAAAFLPRSDEEFLSVNCLEYCGLSDLEAAVGHVRTQFQGRGRIDHQPRVGDESHAGIHGYSSTDLTVAAELALAIHETVYPAVL